MNWQRTAFTHHESFGTPARQKISRTTLTVDRVAEDDGLVDLKLGEERVEAVDFLALRHEGVELRDTLTQNKQIKILHVWAGGYQR